MNKRFYTGTFIVLFWFCTLVQAAESIPNALPSWNEGPVKQSIITFVEQVTDEANRDYVAPENRIAAFDNDGTLWLEQPLYTPALFVLDRIRAMAINHPEWKNQMPFKAVLSNDPTALAKLNSQDMAKLLLTSQSNVTLDDYQSTVKEWLEQTKDPRFKQLYTDLIYQPMLEVIEYLADNQFTIYIVSGSMQDFMRVFAPKTYGIPANHIIGTSLATTYTYKNNHPEIVYAPKVLFMSNYAGKPEAIHLMIGKKPIIAFGNSDGDQQMLEWTQSGEGKRLMLLVHHDDAKREYAYGPDSKIGTFSNALMKEANSRDWKIISMKEDWKVVFPFEEKSQ